MANSLISRTYDAKGINIYYININLIGGNLNEQSWISSSSSCKNRRHKKSSWSIRAAKTGDTKKAAEASVDAFVSAVKESLKKGEKVQLVGFGSFEVRKRAARKGRNPQTKEEIKIPASKAPVFKAGKQLKELVNKK